MNRALSAPQLWRGCRKLRFQNPFRAGPRASSRPRSPPATIADFAPALIAAKPVKPCDRGVFGALNLLLKKERYATRRAHSTQPDANPNPIRLSVFCPFALVCAMNRALPAPQLWRGCRKLRFQNPFRAGPRAGSRPRPPPATIADFAPALIATKPVKPCDGGVFGALNLLLISDRASSESGRVLPSLKPAKATPEAHHLSAPGLIRSCLRNEPGFAASQWQCGCRKPCFSKPVQHEGANRFCRRPSPEKRRLFRSCFDSSKARQTVRWRRFLGLE